ncbi:hypothetical protein STEG23_003332, partial [Scotinomys teguina]
MGQQVGRVGEAPGLQQPQPRGIRGSSAARPSGRRRDPAGRTADTGFNVFTQHGQIFDLQVLLAAMGVDPGKELPFFKSEPQKLLRSQQDGLA